MANYGPVSAWLLVGGNDVTGDIYDMEEALESVIEECHPFTGGVIPNWEKHLPVGIAKVGLNTGQGVYDTRTAGMLDAFQSSGATRQLVNYGFDGNADPVAHVGDKAVMFDGTYAAQWTRKAQRGNITMGQAKHTVTGVRYAGRVAAGHVSRSGDGNTEAAYLDYGAGAYGHGIFDLSVSALSLGGGTNVVVTVKSSPDHITWNTETTFTAVTAAGSSERKLVTGTIDRYLAVYWAFTGGAAQTVKLCVTAHLYT